jgi:serine/threonine protein kinase
MEYDCANDNNIKAKFAKNYYISHIMKLLSLTTNKILPIDDDLQKMEYKINNCTNEYTDTDDYSTVALSSNPTSFCSNESMEDYFSKNEYSFNPDNFKMISILGSGSFGTVFLAEYNADLENSTMNTKTYAVKKLPKSKIHKDQMLQIMEEKNILINTNSAYTLKLYGTCQTNNELFFVTEVLEHGDLFNAIYHDERLSHEACVFYSAGIILGLDFIHRKKIVYRDLKPENIMIGANGYPKIIDFGLAKQLPYMKLCDDNVLRSCSKCNTLCGTPEYIAPEIILNKRYDSAVDLWALGVLIYEMICRRAPFLDDAHDKEYITKMFINIVHCGKNGIVLSKKIDNKTDGTENARKLISQLLSGIDGKTRIGKDGTATSTLLNHPYFLSKYIQSDDLYNQSIIAPIIQDKCIGKDIHAAKQVDTYNGDQEIFKDF